MGSSTPIMKRFPCSRYFQHELTNYWQRSGYFAKSTAFLFLVYSCVNDSLVTFIIWDVVKLWLNLGRLSRYQVPKSSIFQIPIWVDVVYALFSFHSSLMCQMEFTLIELGHLQAKAWCEHCGVSHYLPIYGQLTSSYWWMQIFWTLYLSVVAFIPKFFLCVQMLDILSGSTVFW